VSGSHIVAGVVSAGSDIAQYWWIALVGFFVFGGSIREGLRRHHKRRLDIISAKAEVAERKRAASLPPPDPQPICGCTHHLSFHNPGTSACAVDDCRCQQYVGPEPLGHIMALPLIDPEKMVGPAPMVGPAADADPARLDPGMLGGQQA
jgi:hypothetical protein